jgi:hypothetical protein
MKIVRRGSSLALARRRTTVGLRLLQQKCERDTTYADKGQVAEVIDGD